MIFAVHNDVHHRVGGWRIHRDRSHHPLSRVISDAAIVIVRPWSVESDHAQAHAIHVARLSTQREVHRVAKGLAGDGIGHAVHVVEARNIDKRHAFADFNRQVRWRVLEAADFHRMICIALRE